MNIIERIEAVEKFQVTAKANKWYDLVSYCDKLIIELKAKKLMLCVVV
jgi:hypothetical protein